MVNVDAGLCAAIPVHVDQEQSAMSQTITLARAEKAIEAGKAAAERLGIAFVVSIVDAGAHLVAFSRMDGAALAAVEVSQAKARTAVYFGQPTGALAPAVQPGA